MKNTASDQSMYASSKEWMRGKTTDELWNQCERADWLIHLAAESNSREALVQAVRSCIQQRGTIYDSRPTGEWTPGQKVEPFGKVDLDEDLHAAISAWCYDITWTSKPTTLSLSVAANKAVNSVAFAAFRKGGLEAWRSEHREMCDLLRSGLQQPA